MILLGACGGDGSSNPTADAPPGGIDAPAIDAAPDAPTGGAFTLTSPTITEGQPIPAVHTCNGANTSPALTWTGVPAGTLSFAVVLTDKSNMLVHAAIYDIPASATGLPADVDKVYAPTDVPGAHQTPAYQASVRGYLGPCPPNQHTYEFKVYAVTAATVPGATMATTKDQLVTILAAHNAGTATLTGTYAQP